MEHTGTYSYGVKNEGAQLTVYEAPLTAEGEIDYVAMEARLYEQFVVPQYLALIFRKVIPGRKSKITRKYS